MLHILFVTCLQDTGTHWC